MQPWPVTSPGKCRVGHRRCFDNLLLLCYHALQHLIKYAEAGGFTQGISEIRNVFSKGDIAVGKNGITVLYFNKDGEWITQEFCENDESLARFLEIVMGASSVRFCMMPKNGVQVSFLSDKISDGNIPTFLYPRLENPMSDEEFQRRVSEYGPPKEPNKEAQEILEAIDPNDENSVQAGFVKWILAIMGPDDNLFDFAKMRDWNLLKRSAELYIQKYPWIGELEITDPINSDDYGFAEFCIHADRERVLQFNDDVLAGFRDLVCQSRGIILETARQNGNVYINLAFSV